MSDHEMQDTFLEILYTMVFQSTPHYLCRVTGEGPAAMVLREGMREATLNLLSEDSNLKRFVEGLVSDEERLGVCYRLMAEMGTPFEYEVVEETPGDLTIRVYECPHIEHTRENPVACNACGGIHLAIIEVLFGLRVPVLEATKCMAIGDEYCEYTMPKRT